MDRHDSPAPITIATFCVRTRSCSERLAAGSAQFARARLDCIGLFGHLRGTGPILSYVLRAADVQAAVLNSGGYPGSLSAEVNAPLLILHGTADNPADGGVELTNVQRARGFEQPLRITGKDVEAVYYDGGQHNDIFTNPTQYKDPRRAPMRFARATCASRK